MRVRFRYREYLGGPDPSAGPPPDEAVAASRALLALVAEAEADTETDRVALATAEKALVRYGEGERAALEEIEPRPLARALGAPGREAAERLAAADHVLSPGELDRLAEVALEEFERARPVNGDGSAVRGAGGGTSRSANSKAARRTGESTARVAGSKAARPATGTARATGPDGVADAVATVHAAARRGTDARSGEKKARTAGNPGAAGTGPATGSAVSLLVELSRSMALRGLHEPATRAALALHASFGAHHPPDRFQLVGFDETAREMTPGSLVAHDWGLVPGTNLHGALRAAREHLEPHSGTHRHIMVVLGNEPTAHTGADGDTRFSHPAGPSTMAATAEELDAVLREGARVTFFLLSDEPRLRAFAGMASRRESVRVLNAGADDLGPLLLERFHAPA